MCFAVALKVATAVEFAGVLEIQSSRCRIRTHDGRIKIYQVAVIRARALDRADAVSIVTCRAGNLLLQVFGMPCKAFVVQDAVSAVTRIAKLVRITALLRIIGRLIPVCEKVRINGAVRAFGA